MKDCGVYSLAASNDILLVHVEFLQVGSLFEGGVYSNNYGS